MKKAVRRLSVTATEISYNPQDYQWQLVVSSRNSGKNYDISEVTDGEITWSTERGGHAGKVPLKTLAR